jgi:hypothetical protein
MSDMAICQQLPDPDLSSGVKYDNSAALYVETWRIIAAQSRGQTYAERSETVCVERGFCCSGISKVPCQHSTSLDQERAEFAETHRTGGRCRISVIQAFAEKSTASTSCDSKRAARIERSAGSLESGA